MQYMSIWRFNPDHARSVAERFQETGGAQPPDGVRLVGRWFDVAAGRGFAVVESDDPVALSKWTRQWNDLMSFEVVPVINDEQILAAMQD